MKIQRYRLLVEQAPRGTKAAIGELIGASKSNVNDRIRLGIKTLRMQILYQQAFNVIFNTKHKRDYLFEMIDYEPKNKW